jgi:Flp pilus assembly protein TadB
MMNLIEDFIHWLLDGAEVFAAIFLSGLVIFVFSLVVFAAAVSPLLGLVVVLGLCFGVPLAAYRHVKKRGDN